MDTTEDTDIQATYFDRPTDREVTSVEIDEACAVESAGASAAAAAGVPTDASTAGTDSASNTTIADAAATATAARCSAHAHATSYHDRATSLATATDALRVYRIKVYVVTRSHT